MARQKKKMTEEDILTALESQIQSGVGYFDSKLSREREQVLKYFNGTLPAPFHSGNSKYVSMDVYDTVESTKALLLEVFAAGSNIVEFTPQGPEDVEPARVCSVYTDYVFFRQNDGYGLMSDTIDDALKSRNGIVKAYWDQRTEEVEETFESLAADEFIVLMEDPQIELVDYDHDPLEDTYSGTLIRKINKSQVRVDVIPPEEFIISPRAKSITDAPFVAHRCQKTQGELIREGYSRKLVEKLSTDETWQWDSEKLARLDSISAGSQGVETEYAPEARSITVFECYIQLDIDGKGKTKLWKITKAGETILDREVVSRVPFKDFCPLPIPHSFYGSNFAKLCIPIQNARTVLMRGILDHTVRTNNPRTMVVKGALVNPREMLDNRIGGIVNITRPDGIFPEPQAALNPFVFNTIQLLDEDKEDTTGVSKLSQGLNKDAVSKQNSQGMVENLVTLSQQRQKIVARNFAYKFIVPLMLEIYQLVIENESQQKIIEVAGSYETIDTRDWEERKDVQVALKLGYGEQEKDAQECMELHAFLSQDPKMQRMYGEEQAYRLVSTYMQKKGKKNVNDYLIPFEELEPPQPDPMVAKQMELEERKVALEEQKVQIAGGKAEAEARMDQMTHELSRMSKMIELMVSQREIERKEFEAQSRHDIGQEELALLKANPPAETKQTQIVSPNS